MRRADTGRVRSLINLDRPRNRVRWTMAHELAHIILGHVDKVPPGGLSEDMFQWMEREADVFAEELLMPWEFIGGFAFRKLQEWAEHLEVSQEACAWRLLQVPRMRPADGAAWLGLSDADFTGLIRQCSSVMQQTATAERHASVAPAVVRENRESGPPDAITVVGQFRRLSFPRSSRDYRLREDAEAIETNEEPCEASDGKSSVPFEVLPASVRAPSTC